jgi:hypothetical protein
MSSMRTSLHWQSLLAALLCACAPVDEHGPAAVRDRAVFDAAVWPLLVRDCGFSECHGSAERFFRVVGPGHERLDPTLRLSAPVTEAELQFSYDRARSMVNAAQPSESLLLRKPLDVAAGGVGHEGTDEFGMDVYHGVDDPRFQALVSWVRALPPP